MSSSLVQPINSRDTWSMNQLQYCTTCRKQAPSEMHQQWITSKILGFSQSQLLVYLVTNLTLFTVLYLLHHFSVISWSDCMPSFHSPGQGSTVSKSHQLIIVKFKLCCQSDLADKQLIAKVVVKITASNETWEHSICSPQGYYVVTLLSPPTYPYQQYLFTVNLLNRLK